MRNAGVKKPAAGIAGLNTWEAGKVYNVNIADQVSTVNVPDWMTEKLAKIAAKTDIWTFEQEAAVILGSEIRCFPKHAQVLPDAFRQKALTGKPRELEPLERAAVIVAAYDWRSVCDLWDGAPLEEKVAAQFDALVFALRQGGAA